MIDPGSGTAFKCKSALSQQPVVNCTAAASLLVTGQDAAEPSVAVKVPSQDVSVGFSPRSARSDGSRFPKTKFTFPLSPLSVVVIVPPLNVPLKQPAEEQMELSCEPPIPPVASRV